MPASSPSAAGTMRAVAAGTIRARQLTVRWMGAKSRSPAWADAAADDDHLRIIELDEVGTPMPTHMPVSSITSYRQRIALLRGACQ